MLVEQGGIAWAGYAGGGGLGTRGGGGGGAGSGPGARLAVVERLGDALDDAAGRLAQRVTRIVESSSCSAKRTGRTDSDV